MSTTAERSAQGTPPAPTAGVDEPVAVAPMPRLTGLDGLRGIAILSVLFFHNGFKWAVGSFLAVSLFFTLSGYLITTLLIREASRAGRIDLLRFWGRRLRRIVPAALLALLLVAIFGAVAATPTQQLPLRGDIWAALANVTNWRLLVGGRSYADLFADPSPLQHFWSLAIEEQFYLFYPLIVAGCAWYASRRSRPGRRARSVRVSLAVVTAALGAASIAAQLGIGGRDHVYYGTDSRAWEILAGVLLACALTGKPVRTGVSRTASVVGAAAFVVMLFAWSQVAFGSHWLYIGGLAAFALIDVAVVFAATLPGPVRWLCSWKPLVWIGLISYGLYLFHWPIYVWLDAHRTGLTEWPLFFVRVSITGALAVASYFLVEMPIREGRYPKSWRAPVAWIGGVAVVAVAAWLLIPTPSDSSVITASDFTRAEQLVRDARSKAPAPDSQARSAAQAAGVPVPLHVYVVGDSTGSLFAGGLAIYQQDTGVVDVRSAALATCGFVRADELRWADGSTGTPKAECATKPEQWRQDLVAEKPDAILVMGGAMNTSSFRRAGVAGGDWTSIGEPAGRAAVQAALADTVATLREAAPGVPLLLFTAPYTERLRLETAAPGDSASDPARIDAYNAMLADLAKTTPGVTLVPWADYFNGLSTEADASLRPDGFHADVATVDRILHDWAWTRITAAYTKAAASS